jgi:hypothetical protein
MNRAKWKDSTFFSNDRYFKQMLTSSQNTQKAYGYLWWLNGQADYYDNTVEGDPVVHGSLYPAMPEDARMAMGHFEQRIEVIPSLDLIVIRQGDETGLPEFGTSSFDNELWLRLMKAIKGSG